ncbi:MAG: hypothetical protein E7266_08070 [Lachnospiraceae bacterium]|nr:hypothetical protein [Lachnospiraceae bacterium]
MKENVKKHSGKSNKFNSKTLGLISAITAGLVVIIIIALAIKGGSEKNPGGTIEQTTEKITGNDETKDYTSLFNEQMSIVINITEDDLFLLRETPSTDNYYSINVSIGGYVVENAAIKIKGKNSLESVYENGSNDYSYKIDFNKLEKGQTLLGLDGINLDNMAKDDTKEWQQKSFDARVKLGGIIPLYASCLLTVNNEEAVKYFATEELNDSFVERITDDENAFLLKADKKGATLLESDSIANYEIEYGDYDETTFGKLIEVLNSSESTETDIEAILDVESVLKAAAVNFVMGNYGTYQGPEAENFYLLYSDGKFHYIEDDYSCAGRNYDNDGGLSKEVTVEEPFYRVEPKKRPLISKLLNFEKYMEMYKGYVEMLG